MNIYNVEIDVAGRTAFCTVKEGVVATMELGSHIDRVITPEHKVTLIVGKGKNGISAWVQVSEFSPEGILTISHDGWIDAAGERTSNLNEKAAPKVKFERAEPDSADALKCASDTSFGPLACCIAYGNGCYVKCCGGCCSDPMSCPGASCCS